MNEHESNDNWRFKARKDIIIWLIKKQFNNNKDLALLDVGSWTWYFLEHLMQAWYKNISGFDSSKDSIILCKNKWIHIEFWSLPKVDLYKKYDCITCLDVIEHVDQDKESIKNIINVLKDDGTAIFTVPAYKFLWWHHDEINHHKKRYVRHEFKKLIESAWWKIKYISYFNFFLFPIALLFKYINKKNDTVDSKVSWFLNKIFYSIFRSEFWFIKQWFRFPFWVSIIACVGKK